MPYYLSSYYATRSRTGGLRCEPWGWKDQPGAKHIDLRPDGGATLGGGGLNACLLYLPVHDPDPRLEQIGDNTRELMSQGTKDRLWTRLNLLQGLRSQDLRNILFELMLAPPENGWKPLRPRTRSNEFVLHLGSTPLRLPVIRGGTTITEDWNCTDSASLTCDLTWTEVEGSDLEILSNEAHMTGGGASTHARADTDLASDDHYAQVVLAQWPAVSTGTDGLGVICRKDSTATMTFYRFATFAVVAADTRELVKLVGGTETALETDTTAVAAGNTIYVDADGSTQEARVNGSNILNGTDTAITGNTRTGVFGLLGGSATVSMDNFEAADLAAAGSVVTPRLIGLLGVGA